MLAAANLLRRRIGELHLGCHTVRNSDVKANRSVVVPRPRDGNLAVPRCK